MRVAQPLPKVPAWLEGPVPFAKTKKQVCDPCAVAGFEEERSTSMCTNWALLKSGNSPT